jgi:hypothetical protein
MTLVLIRTSIAALVCGAVLGAGATPASAQEVPAEYQGVLKFGPQVSETPLDGAMRAEPFVDQNEVELEFEKVVAAPVQVRRTSLHGFPDDWLAAVRRHDRRHSMFRQVLIDATGLVQTSKRRLVAMDHVAALRVVQTLEVDSSQAIHDAMVAGFREERVVVHESPQRDQAVETAGVLVVPEDAMDPQHGCTVICTGSCLAGS